MQFYIIRFSMICSKSAPFHFTPTALPHDHQLQPDRCMLSPFQFPSLWSPLCSHHTPFCCAFFSSITMYTHILSYLTPTESNLPSKNLCNNCNLHSSVGTFYH